MPYLTIIAVAGIPTSYNPQNNVQSSKKQTTAVARARVHWEE